MHPGTDTVRHPELWAGVECTVNRVGEDYYDQLERSGHVSRISDLDLFAGLGVTALRYPVLWERTIRDDRNYDWSWSDERLERLRQLELQPIVGLLHHGSGPRFTSLIDPAFPDKLESYARAVAERYPWIDRYTPVNEPLTTARFSGLYGHWYPHRSCNRSFARALLGQCRGIILAMRAIRQINPAAELVQTEDLGKTHSTQRLQYQARFENERRWLTFDLLCGKVDRSHYLYRFLVKRCDVDPSELAWFVDNPLPPDLLGINHYLTSERFLDERIGHYPGPLRGSNGRHRYADVEAVRVLPSGMAGPERLLQEVWERYHLPIAVTECHLGCTREQQMRWFTEVWETAVGLSNRGADIRAVTAWSLLGSYDWNSLLTRNDGHYEPGVFDLSGGSPRPTALAELLRAIATGEPELPPMVEGPGWWHMPERLIYPPPREMPTHPRRKTPSLHRTTSTRRTLLICGARGRVGRAFLRICHERGLDAIPLGREKLDIADSGSVEAMLREFRPWGVVNAAGYVHVDSAEHEEEVCHRENTLGSAILAGACAREGARLVSLSTDLVFNGEKEQPYVESDSIDPLSVYGRCKAEAEQAILQEHPGALVVRTGAFFDPWDSENFIANLLHQLQRGDHVAAASDLAVSPTYLPDMVNGALDLLIDGESGIWHLANKGVATWAELARSAARLSQLDPDGVIAVPASELGLRARRPSFSALASERGLILPTLDHALRRFVAYRHRMAQKPASLDAELAID